MNAIIIALALIASLSPAQARQRTFDASRKEAAKICVTIEDKLSGHYAGGSFLTEFECEHPFTAYYVGEHFKDHWVMRWNDWYSDVNWPGGFIYDPNSFKPKPVRIGKNKGWLGWEYVDGMKWRIELAPKGGGR